MNRHHARALAPFAAVAALATLTACTGEATASDADGEVVRVATQRQPHLYAPYTYADHAPDGMTIQVVPMANSTDQLNAVLTGDVDFALMGVPTVISGVAQGKDVRLVASGADGGSGIIGSPDVAGVEDLAGARIGIVPGSSQEIALRLTLEAAGIDPETDVELVNLGYADMADALARGDIDAFAGAEVNVSVALLAGAHEVTSIYDTAIGPVNIGLATTGTLVEEDPELVQEVVDTHAAAVDALLADPEAWKEGVADQFSFEPEVLDSATENIWLRADLDDEYLAQVEALAGEMVDLAVIDEAPAVTDVVADTFAGEGD
ncbi:ABC transporter substrate-binding protein [Isoptericola dokdonensis]|uniref:Taurine transporter substrate binding subunit n=1 Tax=Isoptericola dokdonensis DS-3 TaxID=1300344 RepID=A0A168FIA8_9MICO|nr:NrtA/SsuA/CpmA family ABC transporter substrate-binding protein [Isoptericola dokdonensis]ANC31841.1 taurine transporter substrate binding subunit [Isoptericola dokdonensis DS-3]